jgi:hypothetical protein
MILRRAGAFCFAITRRSFERCRPSIRRRQDISPTEYSALGSPEQVRQRLKEYVNAARNSSAPYGPRKRRAGAASQGSDHCAGAV